MAYKEGLMACNCDHHADPTDTDETRDYLVTAIVQLVVPAENRTYARISVAETLYDVIDRSPYASDPMNGIIIEDIEDLSQEG